MRILLIAGFALLASSALAQQPAQQQQLKPEDVTQALGQMLNEAQVREAQARTQLVAGQARIAVLEAENRALKDKADSEAQAKLVVATARIAALEAENKKLALQLHPAAGPPP